MKKFNKNNGKRSDRRDSRRFDRRGSHGSNRRSFGRRRSEPATMHKTICDECGKECEVPFKPTEGKPIYCSDCFKKKGGSGKSGQYEKEFAQINEKLDKILEKL